MHRAFLFASGDSHDTVFLSSMGRDEYDRPRFNQRKGPTHLQLTHESSSWYSILSGSQAELALDAVRRPTKSWGTA